MSNLNNIGDRFRYIRTTLGLSMDSFGKSVGITRSSVSLIESGRNNPSEQTIMLVCSIFNVNRDFLINSVEEPFLKNEIDSEFMQASLQISLQEDELGMELLLGYWKLSDESKKIFGQYIKKMAEKVK